ncbi:MAG: hypothetical protein FJ271_29295 [Planctomycetes bacterium]|nr:hypothetical protein [Planctomycetota bacterium]
MSTIVKRSWMVAAVALAVSVSLVGSWLRGQRDECCQLDGMPLVAAYRVRVLDDREHSHVFCSVRCAEIWLRGRNMPTAKVYVTDETSGEELLAPNAHFVRSLVWTTRVSGNRVHVFRDRADAESHASQCRGTLLDDAQRPFAVH